MKRLFLGILAICWVIGVKAQEVFSPDDKINVRFFLSEKVSLIIQVTDGLLPMIQPDVTCYGRFVPLVYHYPDRDCQIIPARI